MNVSTERRVECETGKLLCRVNAQGILLWCQKHRREGLLTWDQLEALEEHYTRRVEVFISDSTVLPVS